MSKNENGSGMRIIITSFYHRCLSVWY